MGTSANIGAGDKWVSEIADGKFGDAVWHMVDFDGGINIWEFTDNNKGYLSVYNQEN